MWPDRETKREWRGVAIASTGAWKKIAPFKLIADKGRLDPPTTRRKAQRLNRWTRPSISIWVIASWERSGSGSRYVGCSDCAIILYIFLIWVLFFGLSMSNYTPDDDSVLAPPWTTVELVGQSPCLQDETEADSVAPFQAHRDVSLQIPINAVTHPAVSLSAACFGKGVYELEAAKRCISNLIAVGYRRLYVDLYWSADVGRWGFCPVAILPDADGVNPVPTTSVPPATMLTDPLTATDLPDTFTENLPETTPSPDRRRSPGASMPVEEVVPDLAGQPGDTLYTLGPYSCSQSLDISTLIRVLSDYFDTTANTLEAHLFYLIFNVHSATEPESLGKPSRAPSSYKLPSGADSIGNIFEGSVSRYIYRPEQLAQEREDVNEWYGVEPQYIPVGGYFTTERNSQRRLTTSDGWPCEGYTGLVKAKRLLLGWGNIDPQMKAYDFQGDSGAIFDPGAFSSHVKVRAVDGNLESGCLYNTETKNVGDVDFSWAIAEIPDTNLTSELSNISLQLSSCGISPLVNSTLLNATADADIEPYRNVSLSSVWSWGTGEPRNSSDINSPAIDMRHLCAVLDLDLSGQWRSTDCSNEYYAACRVGGSPYEWNVTSKRVTYSEAVEECSTRSDFSVPRTGLENTYLYSFLESQRESVLGDYGRIWMDLNSLDVATCWVEGGPKAQCPYELDFDAIQRRTIIIPTVAAIVVLLVTALTLFVKCNANRRNSRRRRVIEGWEYEGVPS